MEELRTPNDELLILMRNTIRKIISNQIPDFRFTDLRLINGIDRKPESQKFVVCIEIKVHSKTHILSATEHTLASVGEVLVKNYFNIPSVREQYFITPHNHETNKTKAIKTTEL